MSLDRAFGYTGSLVSLSVVLLGCLYVAPCPMVHLMTKTHESFEISVNMNASPDGRVDSGAIHR